MHKKELLRRSGLACLTIAFLACVLSLLFLNTHLLQRRAFAYATSEENKGGVVWKLSGESGNEWTIRDDGGAVLATRKIRAGRRDRQYLRRSADHGCGSVRGTLFHDD